MFNRLSEIGLSYGFDVTVAYQSYTDFPRRNWDPKDMPILHRHFFSKRIFGKTRRSSSYFQLNLDILILLIKKQYSHILYSPVGSLCGWFVGFFLRSETRKIYWVESNMASTRRKGLASRLFKRFLLSGGDCFAISGVRSFEYVDFFVGMHAKTQSIILPNLIDSQYYCERIDSFKDYRGDLRKSFGLSLDKKIILAVGEICERKGIDQLIRAAIEISGSYQIVVLGSGPKLLEWRRWIEQEDICERVLLKGYCDEDVVLKYLAISDWFIHAAREDPSPLVCIEAVCAGLPVAISNQTGNQPEILDDEMNGYSFDAEDFNDVFVVLKRILASNSNQHLAFSSRSREISSERFDADKVISKFFETLHSL